MSDFKTLTKEGYTKYVKSRSKLDKEFNKEIVDKYNHVIERNRTISNRYYENNKDKVSERHKIAYEKKKTIKKTIKNDEISEINNDDVINDDLVDEKVEKVESVENIEKVESDKKPYHDLYHEYGDYN